MLAPGLKKLLKEGEELPALYKDPSYAKSSNWILSTSQLASEYFEGWGYGEGERFFACRAGPALNADVHGSAVVPEGFGLACRSPRKF